MEMKDNFDDIIRRRWEERQFPVDDRHRADMARLLDNRTRRRGFPFWWLTGIVGITGTALLLFLLFREPGVDVIPQTGPATGTPSSSRSENTPDHTTAYPKQSAPAVTKNTEQEDGLSSAPLLSEAKMKKVQPAIGKVSGFSSPHKEIKKDHSALETQAETGQGHMKQTAMFESTLVVVNAIGNTVDKALHSSDLPPDALSLDDRPHDESAIAPESLTRSISLVPGIATLDMAGLSFDKMPMFQIEPAFKRRHHGYVLAEAGGGMVLGAQPQYSSGWKFRAGAGIGLDVGRRINLMWTAGYLLQQGGFDFERTSTVRYAGFGARSSFNTLSPDRLHHVYSRLSMNYRIRRHLVHGYVGAQWLYGMQGHISVVTQDQLAEEQQSSEYAWLKTDGLNRLRLMTGLGYGYQLTPRIMALAGTDIYLTSLTRDDPALSAEGYYWNGQAAVLHPFLTINYILYGKR